jgi:hypothetical protein
MTRVRWRDRFSMTCTFRQCSLRCFLEGRHRSDPDFPISMMDKTKEVLWENVIIS